METGPKLLYEGPFVKMGSSQPTWRRRWISVFDNGRLEYRDRKGGRLKGILVCCPAAFVADHTVKRNAVVIYTASRILYAFPDTTNAEAGRRQAAQLKEAVKSVASPHTIPPLAAVLNKRGHRLKTWKQRWFCMFGSNLWYYDHECGTVKGVIFLDNVLVEPIPPSHPEASNRTHCLKIYAGAGKDLILETHSSVEQQRWIDAVRTQVAFRGFLPSVVKTEEDLEASKATATATATATTAAATAAAGAGAADAYPGPAAGPTAGPVVSAADVGSAGAGEAREEGGAAPRAVAEEAAAATAPTRVSAPAPSTTPTHDDDEENNTPTPSMADHAAASAAASAFLRRRAAAAPDSGAPPATAPTPEAEDATAPSDARASVPSLRTAAGMADVVVQARAVLKARGALSTHVAMQALQEVGDPDEMDAEEVVSRAEAALLAGVRVLKHGRKGQPRSCLLGLDADTRALTWQSKKHESLPLAALTDVKLGQQTHVFKRTGRRSNPLYCLSLLTSSSDDRTLDLEVIFKSMFPLLVRYFETVVKENEVRASCEQARAEERAADEEAAEEAAEAGAEGAEAAEGAEGAEEAATEAAAEEDATAADAGEPAEPAEMGSAGMETAVVAEGAAGEEAADRVARIREENE
mmetsp:Transcript_28140/g.90925  ORF Transcript_28140/g.90925 Transcript_28140/m.90925 type:complete len:638 (-) Transcript_28140:167-2080(-)